MSDLDRTRFDTYLERHGEGIESGIHDLWASKDESLWSADPHYYAKLGETAYRLGQSMFAHDILEEGFGRFPSHLRIAQLYALSLVKCGFVEKARDLLAALVRKGHRDEETLGILGRVYKEMWLIAGHGDPRDPRIVKSRDLYLHAFKASKGYYSGINAASLSRIIGDEALAEKLARLVLGICLHLLAGSEGARPPARDYWVLATLGETYLLLGDMEKSKKYYGLARRSGAKNYADLASSLRQLRLLGACIPSSEEVQDALRIPAIVAFTGHMIDRPGARRPRFPETVAGAIKAEIDGRLDRLNAGIGYSSAACGSDVLFLESMQGRKAETNVVLPFDRDDFFRTSVEHAGPEWVERARAVLRGCSRILQPAEGPYGGDDFLFSFANRTILGEALLRGKELESTPVLLAAWDAKSAGARGGTADFIRLWESKGLPVETVDIAGIRAGAKAAGRTPGGSGGARADAGSGRAGEARGGGSLGENGRRRSGSVKRAFKAMLFADLVGYSKLREEQLPSFYDVFLCGIARNLRNTRHKPVFKNSWGDCVYFVFDDPVSAAEHALELRDFVRKTNWGDANLPPGMSVRIGLHAGPVYRAWEHIQGRMSYFGYHVTKAARIEPVTRPGNVYASEQFAALLMADRGGADLECNYVGVILLPKEFGRYPIFHIRRKGEID